MSSRYIDFISAYCDRWCERCTFTQRCSAFAANAAIAMCGDVREGLELAVGRPHPAEPNGTPPGPPDWLAGFEQDEPTDEEHAEFVRLLRARDARIESTSLMQAARAYSMLALRWLAAEDERLRAAADPVLQGALEIVAWDHLMIHVKLHRALDGRDEYEHGEPAGGDRPAHNDWNGTAKLVLILLERSEAAWRVIDSAIGSELARDMTGRLGQLRREVEREFPHARAFVRPGFDEQQPV